MSTTLTKTAQAAPVGATQQSSPERGAASEAVPASFAALYRRILRRETHSPRSLVAIVLAVLLILAFAWVGTEIVIALLGAPALLVAPRDMFTSAVNLVEAPAALVAAAGIVVAVIGLVLVIVALSPGRRARHVLNASRTAVVVDNEVIASALARHASFTGDVDPDNASVSVSHRRAVVDLTPTSGVPVDKAAVNEEVSRQLDSYGLEPRVTSQVRISESGRIGA
ncbi:DUF6286 domain-containing protein [Herbiconiux sp. P15]|uniref:DUF6286 domain-containing protein n=1 Tax=Herbiconiux liukaitaii TaxID=3342799 RepID=UPI0035BB7A14